MRQCIRSLLVFLLTIGTLSPPTQASCLVAPLFDPFHWACGLGHQNPAAAHQVIDDWLGYGYLRGQANGSLGHYPLTPGGWYTSLHGGMGAPARHVSPFPGAFPMPAPLPPGAPPWCPLTCLLSIFTCGCPGYYPGYGAPIAPCPQYQPYSQCQPYPAFPPATLFPGATQCQPIPQPPCQSFGSCQPYAPMPQMSDSCCQPIQCQPVQVPVTTYRPVTVDRGSYQMVWVPRPVTTLVPQTTWQTQYPMQQYQQAAPSCDGCGMDAPTLYNPTPMPSGVPMSDPLQMPSPMQVPMQSGCGDTPCQSGGTASLPSPSAYGMNSAMMPNSAAPWQASSAWQPFPVQSLPVQSGPWQQQMLSQAAVTPQYGVWSPVRTAWSPSAHYPSHYSANQYAFSPYGRLNPPRMPAPQYVQYPQQMAFARAPGYGYPSSSAPSNGWQPVNGTAGWQVMPQSGMAGDIMGDHEMATVPQSTPVTGMTPVMPNSFRSGSVPVAGISYRSVSRPQPVNKYRNVVR